MTARVVPLIALVIIVLVSAGCTQAGTVAPPVQTTVSPVTPATTLPGTPASPILVASPVAVTCTTAPAPVTTIQTPGQPGAGFRWYKDNDYSLEYPSSWQTNETTIPLPEFVHTKHGCMVTSYYQTYQRLRFFNSPDGTALMYASIVDTNTDVWPRDLDGQIDYADVVNAILGDPTHCANTPEGAFTISDVTQAPVGGVSYDVTGWISGRSTVSVMLTVRGPRTSSRVTTNTVSLLSMPQTAAPVYGITRGRTCLTRSVSTRSSDFYYEHGSGVRGLPTLTPT